MFKRTIIPLYILIASLIASSLIIKPKIFLFQKFHKINIFVIGLLIILFSQVSMKLIGKNMETDIFFSCLHFIFVLSYYIFLFIKNKFTFKSL